MNDYYVYEWYNIETGEVFYVGKGRKGRARVIANRNRYFKRYYKKYKCDVRIIFNSLSNEESYSKEIEIIAYYKSIGQCKTNITDGGEAGLSLPGKLNPNYGKKHSPEIRKIISEKLRDSGRFKGKKNPQYGISPRERMSSETYEKWLNWHSENTVGVNNPNYGNRKLSQKYKDNPELSKEKQSRPGIKNGRAMPVAMYKHNFYKEFDYMLLCAKYMIDNNICRSKKAENMIAHISESAKTGKSYFGYNFKFI